MKNRYEHNGYTIIIDSEGDGQVYYRKFNGDKYVGAFRMKTEEFRDELEKCGANRLGGPAA